MTPGPLPYPFKGNTVRVIVGLVRFAPGQLKMLCALFLMFTMILIVTFDNKVVMNCYKAYKPMTASLGLYAY